MAVQRLRRRSTTTASWQYARHARRRSGQSRGHRAVRRDAGDHVGQPGARGAADAVRARRIDALVRSLLKPPPQRDETLQHPRCVFQIVKRHFSRYTPEMVERVTGCPQETFLKVAETILANSGPDRTTSFATPSPGRSTPTASQIDRRCALLQLLLGNIGRPGGGIMALRGHASIQGSTDVPTLYHSIHGYMPAPTALKKHDTLARLPARPRRCRPATGPTCRSSWSPTSSRCTATRRPRENDFGYDWHPQDHRRPLAHADVRRDERGQGARACCCIGQNPATSLNASARARRRMRKLDWLVVKDNCETETATFWNNAPEVDERRGHARGHPDRGLLLPVGAGRRDGGHLHQHPAAAAVARQGGRPAGRLPLRRLVHLSARQAAEEAVRRQPGAARPGLQEPDLGLRARRIPHERAARASPTRARSCKEINGYYTDDPGRHLAGFGDLKDDGSTTCASWIYCGRLPGARQEPRRQQRARSARAARRAARTGASPGRPTGAPVQPRLGRPDGQALERAEEVGLVGRRASGPATTCPTSPPTKAPTAQAEPGRHRARRATRAPTRSS